MASGYYRMNRKTAANTYEEVLPKSHSGIIYRPNGRTVEQDLVAYLPEYQASDTVPKSLTNGKIIVTPNHVYAGQNNLDLTKDTVYKHPSSQQCSGVNATKFNGYTYSQFMEKIEDTASAGKIFADKTNIMLSGGFRYSIGSVEEITQYHMFVIEYTITCNVAGSGNDASYAFLTNYLMDGNPAWVLGNPEQNCQIELPASGSTLSRILIMVKTLSPGDERGCLCKTITGDDWNYTGIHYVKPGTGDYTGDDSFYITNGKRTFYGNYTLSSFKFAGFKMF